LLGAVVGLPLLIKDDGTARGFTQILLTYTLGAITALLGLSTLWLACGTLARDIEECQMQVVAVKPIARWQIWLGKWLGIMSLNATLLALSGGSVYVLLQWRAGHLPASEQQVLRNEVLVARGSTKPESYDKAIEAETDQQFKDRLAKNPGLKADWKEVRQQIRESIKAQYQLVPPGYPREWKIHLGIARHFLQGKPLYLRIKFNAADKSRTGTYAGVWRVGVPRKTQLWQSEPMSLAPDTFHEFQIGPAGEEPRGQSRSDGTPAANLPAHQNAGPYFDDQGTLTVGFLNANDKFLLFPLEDGIEVLYPEGGFGLNFIRGLGIIFCWMGLLAALGLASASFLSFPVAAFLSLGVLTLALSSGTMTNAVSEGTLMGYNEDAQKLGHSTLDPVVIPLFRVVLDVINLAKDFSPIDSLSTGRSITWEQLGKAIAQIVLLLGGLLGLFGVVAFTRRELATAQGNQ
jgi:hypothetical protein